MKLLIRNARVASVREVYSADVLVDGERIEEVGAGIPADGARVVDAAGKYLLPGGVDAHTHFDLDAGTARASDDFYSGTVAAACGGTTTIVDHMAFGPKGCRLSHQIGVYHGLAKESVVDYGFHAVAQHVDDQVLADMGGLAAEGITSLKFYLTYGFKLDDASAMAVLARAGELGLVSCVHCENDAVIAFRTRKLLAEGKKTPRYHAESRPAACEAEAVERMLALAEMAGDTPLYIVHLSTERGLESIRRARRRGQKRIFAETCPQYLVLDEGKYVDGSEGLKYIMSPPLRTPADNRALWGGLKDDIDVVATDHCPFIFATQKQAGLGDFSRCPNGAPGVEARMSLVFSEGFMRGRLTLPEVVRLCCERPARIFGLYPKKGVIAPGSDADLVLFDPEIRRTLGKANLHERVDYTPYEGMPLLGAPALTISRGEIIVVDGAFTGKAGRGKYLFRNLPALDAITAG